MEGRGGQTLTIRLDGIGRDGYRAAGAMAFVAETADAALPFDVRGERTQISFYRPGPLRVSVTRESGEHLVTEEAWAEPGDEVILHVGSLGVCLVPGAEWTGSCR